MTTRKKNYVNNSDLTSCLARWQRDTKKATREGLPVPTIPHYVGQCILQICNKLTRGFQFDFTSYTYRDEMVADAVERCVYACSKFNPRKSSSGAFSYLTTVAIHAMKKRINDEKKQNYTKHKYFQTQFLFGELDGLAPNEHSDHVIDDFEARQSRKALTIHKKAAKMKRKKHA